MFSLLFLLSTVVPRFISAQLVQTNATCLSDYSWMGNSKDSSPCMVAAELDAQCNGGHWELKALDASFRYANPAGLHATLCTCSWASYNLISACTACQGYPSSMAVWGDYISGCTGNTTDNNYWPPLIPIPTDVKIPYWASTNPTTWTNQIFSVSDAKTIYLASHPDLPAPTTSPAPSASTPVGAIVGGAIGGLVTICLFIAISICLIRRNRSVVNGAANSDDRLAHMRKISDTTVTSHNTTLADSSSLMPIFQTPSPTNVQRSTSISSLPFFNSFRGRDSRAAGGQTPAPQQPNLLPPLSEFITPFTLPPTNDVPEKKHTDGEWPVFDQPSAPPQNIVQMTVLPSQTTPRKNGTIRYNPPTYSESVTTPTVSRHQAQDSLDSTLSTPLATEASDGTARRAIHTPANSGSSIGHMGISNPRASTSTFQTMQTSISTTRTSVGPVSMARGYGRPLLRARSRETMTEESFSPSEIA